MKYKQDRGFGINYYWKSLQKVPILNREVSDEENRVIIGKITII